MRRNFIAFWDIIIYSLISAFLLSIAAYIIIIIKGDLGWHLFPWWLSLIAAFCIAIPVGLIFTVQKVTIDLNCDKVEWFYLVNYAKNDLDLHSNWIIYPSEVEKIAVVKLTKEEKRRYTSAKFLFSKYLQIEMKYGHVKYVYVSHYSKWQIKKIIELLTSYNK